MKKAIVAVPYLSGKGGTETVIKNFYEAVVANDSEIDWKLVSFGGSKYPDWIKKWKKRVYNFSDKRIIQLGAYVTVMPNLLRKIIKNERPDYFIATNPVIWHLASKYKLKYSLTTKIIAWYHYSYKMKNINPKYLKNVDKFWAISSGIEEELEELGVPSKKIDVIYNPINLDNLPLVKRTKANNHFIYIGRIDYNGQKNVSELIRAFNLVKKDYKLDLYGAVDPEVKNRLLGLIDDKNRRENIIFHGFSTNVWEKIKEADILVLTSKYEGFGLVLCEAAARGITLVSSNCPVGPGEIINKKNGFIYKTGDILGLTKILSDLIEKENSDNSQAEISESIDNFNYKNYEKRIARSLKG